MRGLEELGRVRLSPSHFLRDILMSEVAVIYGIPNIPDDPVLAIAADRLEPLKATFGHIAIRSAYRPSTVNAFRNANGLNCTTNEKSRASHIWDRRDAKGCMGTTACIILSWFADLYAKGAN